jgi:hypothetical protein
MCESRSCAVAHARSCYRCGRRSFGEVLILLPVRAVALCPYAKDKDRFGNKAKPVALRNEAERRIWRVPGSSG